MAKNKNTENEEIIIGSNPVEKYQKPLTIAGIALIAAAIVFVLFRNFYLEPQQVEASSELFTAEGYFAKDSFDLALHGNVEFMGFEEIASDYGMTDAGNLANYYAGFCCLHLANSDSTQKNQYFEDAIDYLSKFSAGSKVLDPMALGGTADAYSELGDYEKAASLYMKAANASNNEYTAPMYLMKAGLVYEELGSYQKAASAYKKIKTDYSTTEKGRNIEKYISRAESKL